MPVAALALPFPIRQGVLTGSLNCNGQAVTNVGRLTLASGPGFTGTVTNLTSIPVVTITVSGAGATAVNDNYILDVLPDGNHDSGGPTHMGHPVYADGNGNVIMYSAGDIFGWQGWLLGNGSGAGLMVYGTPDNVASPELSTHWTSISFNSTGVPSYSPDASQNPVPSIVATSVLGQCLNLTSYADGFCLGSAPGADVATALGDVLTNNYAGTATLAALTLTAGGSGSETGPVLTVVAGSVGAGENFTVDGYGTCMANYFQDYNGDVMANGFIQDGAGDSMSGGVITAMNYFAGSGSGLTGIPVGALSGAIPVTSISGLGFSGIVNSTFVEAKFYTNSGAFPIQVSANVTLFYNTYGGNGIASERLWVRATTGPIPGGLVTNTVSIGGTGASVGTNQVLLSAWIPVGAAYCFTNANVVPPGGGAATTALGGGQTFFPNR